MISKSKKFRKKTATFLVLLLSLLLAGNAYGGYGGGGGGGGGDGGGGGGESSGSVFTGYTASELQDIFGYGFQPPTSGSTVDIGTPPIGLAGAKKVGTWSNIYEIPPGIPVKRLTRREIMQQEQDFYRKESKQQLDAAKDAHNKEKGAKVLAVGCTILGGIGSAVGGATAVGISIIGDGLATGGGTYVEAKNQGDSTGKALTKAAIKGGAKAGSSYIMSKIKTGSDVADTVGSIAGGLTYDEVTSGDSPSAPNTAPKSEPIYAPMSTGGGLGISPVPAAM